MAGAGVYFEGAEGALREAVEALQLPVFMNGLGRGTLPASHPLAFSRARSVALREADLVVAVGTPLDFRLGYGQFKAARVVHLCDAASQVASHVDLAASAAGDLSAVLRGVAGAQAAGVA